MTDKTREALEREQFEAWGHDVFNYGFKPETYGPVDGRMEYLHEGTQMAWEGWQARAALAAPVVEAVPMPKNADQAAAMCLLGERWLRDNAPDRLRARPPAVEAEPVAEIVMGDSGAACNPLNKLQWRTGLHAASFPIGTKLYTHPTGEVEKDAARYRWLRENVSSLDTVADPDNFVNVWYGLKYPPKFTTGRTLDAAIDAAMSKV